MIITICGSSRFKEEILNAAANLTLQGHIVLMPCVFHHADNIDLTTEQKIQLDNLHRQKISMSDAILVVNKDKYIGESTYGEIDWANRMNKEVYFTEEMPNNETEQEPEPEAPAEPANDLQ